jgi:PRTRC genetic system protein E
MFKELAPLLSKRSLILTITSVGEERIRVTITPRPTGKDDVKELAQPFAVEGTAEELDTELPNAIVNYTAQHMTLEKSLADVKAGMEATLKEVKDEAAKKVAEAKKTNKVGAKVVAPAKVEPAKAPEPPSLFDAPATVAAVTSAPSTPAPEPAAATDDDEDESEEDESDDDEPAENEVATVAVPAAAPTRITTAKPATLKVAAAAPSMFDQADEEAEILREAFPVDGETQAVAA